MEKALVTGASGYLGACIFAELGGKYHVEKLQTRLEQIEEKSLEFDLVVHSAGALRYRKGQHKSANDEGTRKLLKGFKNRPKVVYISSKSVYGIGLEGDFTESTTPKPTDDYGKSKYEGERAVIESGFPYIILRSSTLFGLGINNLGPAFPSLAMSRLADGEDVNLFTPDILHEYLYVKDLATTVAKLISIPHAWNMVVNVSGPKRSLHQLIYLIHDFLKKNQLHQPIGKIQEVEQKAQKSFYLDSSKLFSLVGEKVFTPDEEIVKRMYDFYLSK